MSNKRMSNGTSIWFVCRICKRAFERCKYLVRHKRQFHPKNGSEPIQPAVVDQRERAATATENFIGNSDVNNEIEHTSDASLQSSSSPIIRFDKKKKTSFVSKINKDDDEDGEEDKSESSLEKVQTSDVDHDDGNSDLADAPWLKHQGSHKNKESGGFLSENDNQPSRKVVLKRKSNVPEFNSRPQKISNITGTLPSSSSEEDNSPVSSSNEHQLLECTYCKKKVRKDYLKTHERIHAGGYKCRFCPKSSMSSQQRTIHERVHTGERPYKCTHCPKTFAISTSRKNHERVHTGERPHKCSYCPKAFSTLAAITYHERVHTGERRYKCTYCPQAFVNSTNRKNHERVHTGELPYSCGLCNKSFTQMSNRNNHVKRMHE